MDGVSPLRLIPGEGVVLGLGVQNVRVLCAKCTHFLVCISPKIEESRVFPHRGVERSRRGGGGTGRAGRVLRERLGWHPQKPTAVF